MGRAEPVVHIESVDVNHAWALTSGGALYHTLDGRRSWVQFANKRDGWVLFTLGQGCASQEPYELAHTVDGGEHWQSLMTDSSACHPPIDGAPPVAPTGPRGYPVAFASQGSAAWVVVNLTAGGYLDIVSLSEQARKPVSKGQLRVQAPRDAVMGFSVAGAGEAWLVTGDVQSHLGQVLHSRDGGATWEHD